MQEEEFVVDTSITLEEAKKLVENGAEELILVAQDISRYGEDKTGKPQIVKLIQKLSTIEDLKKAGVTEEGMSLEIIKEYYSDNYLAPSVMENMARLYELSGNSEEAKKVYKEIVDKFFGTIYANRASEKLN